MTHLTISSQTKINAQAILDQTKIIDILSKYGSIRIDGSFYTDLMYDPDIDINVTSPEPRTSATNFLNEIISLQLFQKYQYGDFENFPRQHRPKDHIVVLILPYHGQKWEIEIWFSLSPKTKQIELEEKLKSLPQETKNQIIQAKHQRATSGIDKHTLSSFEIYQKFV